MNVHTFLNVRAGDTAQLNIGKPFKKYMVNVPLTLIKPAEAIGDTDVELYDLVPGVVYEVPNNYGYPGQLHVKNNNESAVKPCIWVVEYGDALSSGQAPVPPPTPVLTMITATKTVTTYDVGDVVDYSDVVVTAYYSGKAPANVTASATIGTISTETAGVKTLSISYTEDGVTKTTSISITVSAVVSLDYIVADKLVKEYEVGDVVSYDDITVIAHYTDGSTADVSSEATIGTISTETAGDKTLSVCYSEDEVSECTGISIEVVEPEPPEPVRHDIVPECITGYRIGSDGKIAVHSGDALSYWPVSAGVTYYYDSYNANRMGFFLSVSSGSMRQVDLRTTTTYTPNTDGYIVLTDSSQTCRDLHAYYYE